MGSGRIGPGWRIRAWGEEFVVVQLSAGRLLLQRIRDDALVAARLDELRQPDYRVLDVPAWMRGVPAALLADEQAWRQAEETAAQLNEIYTGSRSGDPALDAELTRERYDPALWTLGERMEHALCEYGPYWGPREIVRMRAAQLAGGTAALLNRRTLRAALRHRLPDGAEPRSSPDRGGAFARRRPLTVVAVTDRRSGRG